MPRAKRPESVRLNLEIAPAVRERLERLRESTGAESLTEVIRRSLSVYETLIEISDSSLEIVVKDKDGEMRPMLLIP